MGQLPRLYKRAPKYLPQQEASSDKQSACSGVFDQLRTGPGNHDIHGCPGVFTTMGYHPEFTQTSILSSPCNFASGRRQRPSYTPLNPLEFESADEQDWDDLQSVQSLQITIATESFYTTIAVSDRDKLMEFYKSRLNLIQEVCMRNVLKAWIKEIVPKKQKHHPYNGGKKKEEGKREYGEKNPGGVTRPDWWPEDIRHHGPDHLHKPERFILAMHILSLFEFSTERLRQSTMNIALSLDERFRVKVPAILDEIYDARRREESFVNGEGDGGDTEVHVRVLGPDDRRSDKGNAKLKKPKTNRESPQNQQAIKKKRKRSPNRILTTQAQSTACSFSSFHYCSKPNELTAALMNRSNALPPNYGHITPNDLANEAFFPQVHNRSTAPQGRSLEQEIEKSDTFLFSYPQNQFLPRPLNTPVSSTFSAYPLHHSHIPATAEVKRESGIFENPSKSFWYDNDASARPEMAGSYLPTLVPADDSWWTMASLSHQQMPPQSSSTICTGVLDAEAALFNELSYPRKRECRYGPENRHI